MLTPPGPALYRGLVRHQRLSPRPHAFTYRVAQAFLDVDRIPEAMRVSPFTSYNRWNWASFDDRDHLGDPRLPLGERLRRDAAREGIALPEGPIYLLTNLRYFGYAFNPVSFFYFYDAAGRLPLVLAEVNNTFGETCNYWLRADGPDAEASRRRHQAAKVFHVSPFLPLDMEYRFTVSAPGERLAVQIANLREGRRVFDATLALTRHAWTANALHRALLAHPWLTATVTAAIHWQALRLSLKKIPFHPHPGTPPSAGRPRKWRDETA